MTMQQLRESKVQIGLEGVSFDRRSLLASFGAVGASALLAGELSAQQTNRIIAANLKAGDLFPDLTLKNRDGKEVTFSEATKGKLVLVEFWGVYCPPCLADIPRINSAYAALKDREFHYRESKTEMGKGFEVFSVACHADADDHGIWVDMQNRGRFKTPLHVETSDGRMLVERYGVSSVPTNFLVDSSGRIIVKNIAPGSLPSYLKSSMK